jgi:hypothetical protein
MITIARPATQVRESLMLELENDLTDTETVVIRANIFI